MLKRITCAALGLIMLFVAVACSPSDATEDTNEGFGITDITTSEPETTEEPEETEAPLEIKEDTLVFVQNNISEYTIIRPESSTDANRKAASELRSYINKITGVQIPIKTDSEPAGEYEILVGYTNLRMRQIFPDKR